MWALHVIGPAPDLKVQSLLGKAGYAATEAAFRPDMKDKKAQ